MKLFLKSLLAIGSLFLSSNLSFAETIPLKVGLTGKYPPFNYFNADGKLTGFDVDIAKSICKSIDRPCEFVILQWDGIVSALLSQKIDVIIASMAITEERKKKVLFSDPYYESGAQIFTSKKFQSSPHLNTDKMIVGYTLGTTYGDFAKKIFSDEQLRTYRGDIEIFQDLGTNRIQGIITDKLVGQYLANIYHVPIVPSGETLYEEQIGIALPPDNALLLQKINRAIREIKKSGEYIEIYQRYFNSLPNLEGKNSGPSWTVITKLMIKGLKNTVFLSLQGISIGILIAFGLAGLTLSKSKTLSNLSQFLVDFIRSTPFLVQILAIYFGLPTLGMSISAWPAAVLAIALHSSAYLSEGIKGAFLAIPSNQHHAAKCLGLSKAQAFLYVILPQMLPLLLPAGLNTIIAMIKDSAVVSVISIHELTLSAQELIGTTFNPIKFYGITVILYFLITYPLLKLGKRIQDQSKVKGLLHG